MTWLEKLNENPRNFSEFCEEISDSYSETFRDFVDCIAEFEIFRKLGLKRSPCPSCIDNCSNCIVKFLSDSEVYVFTTKGGYFD